MNEREPSTLRYWPVLSLIVIGSLLLRLLHFSVALGSDDQVWMTVAREIASSAQPTDQPVYYTRLLWTWLLIVWGWLGSLTLEWSAVLMFALSGLTTTLIAATTRRAFGERAALLAAAVYAVHPLAVTYDTVTLPDGFAVCLLAAVMAMFVSYLGSGNRRLLLTLGLVIGLLFGVKNYFVLLGLPCALTILASPLTWAERAARVAMVGGAAVTGLLLTMLLGLLSGIDAGSHVVSAGEYVDYISRDAGGYQGWRQLAAALVGRTEYLVALFFGSGAALGLLTLLGIGVFVFRWRRSPNYLFVAATFLVFLLFLMLLPVRLSPLLFTQVQERYLTVVLPALAVATGLVLHEVWRSLTEPTLRRSAALVFLAVVGLSAWLPNDAHDRFRLLELRALDQVLDAAPRSGTRELLLSFDYRRLVPDSYRTRGVELGFYDFGSEAGSSALLARVAAEPSVAIVVFRTPYRMLREKLRTGDYDERVAHGSASKLMDQARSHGLDIEEVRVPYDTMRLWLARAGIETRGQLVGWIVRKHAP